VTFSSRQASSQLLVATFLRISNVFPGKLTKNALKTLATQQQRARLCLGGNRFCVAIGRCGRKKK